MPRPVVTALTILFGVVLGGAAGLGFGYMAIQFIVTMPGRAGGMEDLALAVLIGFGTPLVGAIVGGVVAARSIRNRRGRG
ncbi:hypothetical protein ACFQU3_23475 [Terrabacter sp. GCM10028922]|uniref:hypothetical protein n=1 Tax=Terrabacter sp. GCM10028922 TaxID=3273428 RepID=UPI00361FCC0B